MRGFNLSILVLVLSMLCFSRMALAACSNNEDGNPGQSGEIEYFTATKQLMYCDSNDNWVLMRDVLHQTSLLGHWKLDETSGTTATDSSGNGYNGTYGNITLPTDSGDGVISEAVDFANDGNARFTAPDNAIWRSSRDITLSAWVKSDGTYDGVMTIVEIPDTYMIRTSFNGSTIRFFPEDWDTQAGAFQCGDASHNLKANEWVHIAVTYSYNDAVGTFPSMYVNGESCTTPTWVITPSGSYDDGGDTFGPVIGRRHDSTNSNFHGFIDDVRIYGKALTADDIKALYAQGASDVGLVGYWKLDETSGTSYTESSPSGLTSTSAFTVDSVAGKIGTGVKFNSNNDAIASTTSIYNSLDEVTMAYWAKVNSSAETSNLGYNNVFQGAGISISNYWSNPDIEFRVGRWDGTSAHWRFPGTKYVREQWVHVALTLDIANAASGATPKLYINGIDQGAVTVATAPSGNLIDSTSTTTRIGHYSSSPHFFKGVLDDFRIYNRVLSAEEIMALSSCSNGGDFYFNDDAKTYQWCDGQNVWDMGPRSEGSSGTSHCTGTVDRGGMNYTNGSYYYCPTTYLIPVGRKCTNCGGSSTEKVVFVTTEGQRGNKGGLAGADAYCQADADAAGLSGTYMAWLSDDTGSPSTRFSATARGGTVSFVTPDGTTIANDWTDLTDGTLDASAYITVYGARRAAAINSYFTNTNTDGTLRDGSFDCSDWTSSSSSLSAYRGTGGPAATWTYIGGSFSTNFCNQYLALLCFEQ